MKKCGKDLLLWILCVCITGTLCLIEAGIGMLRYDAEALTQDDGKIYITLQHEGNPLLEDVQYFAAIEEQLQRIEGAVYYEIYGQPIYLNDAEEETLAALQVSDNVLESFGIRIQSGRGFTKADYRIGERVIPVLAGAALAERFKTGDHFFGEYLFDEYEFVVIGILQEESWMKRSQGSWLLDESIVMPAFHVDEESGFGDGLRIHYANLTSGMLCTEAAQRDVVLEQAENILASEGQYGLTTSSMALWVKHMTGLSVQTMICCLVIMATGFGLLLLQMYWRKQSGLSRGFLLVVLLTNLIIVCVMGNWMRYEGIPINLFWSLCFVIYPLGLRLLRRKSQSE
ncbi:MAG: ABC transporter permease [Eubacteriales bacterium]|nr:ABC transporter permease [Eubacteriales bacterium]